MKLIIIISKFFLSHLMTIHKGTILAKIKSSAIIGITMSSFAYQLESLKFWLISNVFYLELISIALLVDLLMGIYVHAIKFKDFSLKKMVTGFLSKLFLTSMGLVLFEVFKSIFKNHNVDIGDYFKLTIALIVISYPLFSAFGNLSVATNGKFPPIGWMNKIKKFQENINLSNLTVESDEQE